MYIEQSSDQKRKFLENKYDIGDVEEAFVHTLNVKRDGLLKENQTSVVNDQAPVCVLHNRENKGKINKSLELATSQEGLHCRIYFTPETYICF